MREILLLERSAIRVSGDLTQEREKSDPVSEGTKSAEGRARNRLEAGHEIGYLRCRPPSQRVKGAKTQPSNSPTATAGRRRTVREPSLAIWVVVSVLPKGGVELRLLLGDELIELCMG
ncbi:hypothetical protein Dimus_004404 [Dionaea muscipula]